VERRLLSRLLGFWWVGVRCWVLRERAADFLGWWAVISGRVLGDWCPSWHGCPASYCLVFIGWVVVSGWCVFVACELYSGREHL